MSPPPVLTRIFKNLRNSQRARCVLVFGLAVQCLPQQGGLRNGRRFGHGKVEEDAIVTILTLDAREIIYRINQTPNISLGRHDVYLELL